MRCFYISLSLVFFLSDAWAQCESGGLAVVISKKNSTDNLSVGQLRRVFLGDVPNWPDQNPVALVWREAGSPVSKCFLSTLVRMNDSEYRRYLSNSEIRRDLTGRLKTANSDGHSAKILGSWPGGIAIVDAASLSTISDSVKVVRINGKRPGEPGYPF